MSGRPKRSIMRVPNTGNARGVDVEGSPCMNTARSQREVTLIRPADGEGGVVWDGGPAKPTFLSTAPASWTEPGPPHPPVIFARGFAPGNLSQAGGVTRLVDTPSTTRCIDHERLLVLVHYIFFARQAMGRLLQ